MLYICLIQIANKMSNLSKLQKQAKPKFMLTAWNSELETYIFIADSEKCKEAMCVNISKALLFSYGFDDENIKEKAWSLATGFQFMAIAV